MEGCTTRPGPHGEKSCEKSVKLPGELYGGVQSCEKSVKLTGELHGGVQYLHHEAVLPLFRGSSIAKAALAKRPSTD